MRAGSIVGRRQPALFSSSPSGRGRRLISTDRRSAFVTFGCPGVTISDTNGGSN
jgi:hypothetical protein